MIAGVAWILEEEHRCPVCGDVFQLDILDDCKVLPLHSLILLDPSPSQTESTRSPE